MSADDAAARVFLAKALVAAQAEMPAVDKTGKSNFGAHATLDHIIAKTRNVLNKHGLSITQLPVVTELGGPGLRTTITHTSGESESAVMPLLLVKQDMQSLGSAITYARRYAWAAALGISAEADDDGEHATRPSQGSDEAPGPASGANPASARPPVAASPPAAPPSVPASSGNIEGEPKADASVSQAAADEPASPSFPIPAAVQDQLATEGKVAPDSGLPQDVAVHFGKNAGTRLGDMTKRQVEWYAANDLRPDASPADKRLKAAAMTLLELGVAGTGKPTPSAPVTDEEIPF